VEKPHESGLIINLRGPENRLYQIESSRDLIRWEELLLHAHESEHSRVIQAGGLDQEQRFYRALLHD
jgi:hypothetical protein